MRIPTGGQIANRAQAVGNRVLGNHFAVYSNPLSKRDEVRGSEEAGAIPLRATDGIDHGTDGAFASGACDVDDLACRGTRRGEPRVFGTNGSTTFVEQAPDIFQPELDAEALEAVEPGARLLLS